MTTVTARQGDTFASISRRTYGTEVKAGFIRKANPSISEPISEGATLTIPSIPGAPTDKAGTSQSENISILIGGAAFTQWTDVVVSLAIDKPPTVTLSSPWEPDVPELKRVFKPFSFQPIAVSVGPDPLFTGVMLTPSPAGTADGRVISASAYGKTGTAYDCTAPASAYPLEFDNLTIDAIASQLLSPFGILPVFTSPAGAPFERVSMQTGERVMDFLAGLAKQRNLVIGESATGDALFRQSAAAGAPVAVMDADAPPASAVAPSFNAQAVYSDITAIAPAVPGIDGAQSTAKNSRLSGVVRPFTFTASDTQATDLEQAAAAKLGRMYANAVSWVVPVPSWRAPGGELWQPNTTIKLTAPAAMIYSRTEFLIKEVRFVADENSKEAYLTIVLPGAFSGQIPEALPWE